MTNRALVGLFGTCNNSTWREELIKKLDPEVDYFNPVVDDWNEEAQKIEDEHKQNDSFILITLTPLATGFYTIAEIMQLAYHSPERLIFCCLDKDADLEFNDPQKKSIKKICKDIEKLGVKHIYDNLDDVADFINTYDRCLR